MLTIKDKRIFADDGTLLKVVYCPKNVDDSDFTQTSARQAENLVVV